MMGWDGMGLIVTDLNHEKTFLSGHLNHACLDCIH